MARRRNFPRRGVTPDTKYGSKLITRFINYIMVDGKKSLARSIIYEALEIIEDRTNEEGIEVFRQAIDNVKPSLEVKARRVGGATFQVPMEVDSERQVSLALRWITDAVRSSSGGRPIVEKIANELLDAYNNQGTSVEKKESTHQMAKANRAFAHYRW